MTMTAASDDGESAPARFDVIVVGAGIMGSCAAYAAASRGARVLLLERFDLLHHRGSSHGESRTIRATYTQPHYPPMARLSKRLWDEAQADAGYRVLTPTPHVDIGPKDEASLLAAIRNGGAAQVEVPAAAGSWPWAGCVQGARRVDGGGERVRRRDEGDQGGGHVPGARHHEGRRRQGPGRGRRHHQARRRNDPGEDSQWRGVPWRQVHHNGRRLVDQASQVGHRHGPARAASAHPHLLLEGEAGPRARDHRRGRLPDVGQLRHPLHLQHSSHGVPGPDQDRDARRAALRPGQQGLAHGRRGPGGARGPVDRHRLAGPRGDRRRAGDPAVVHVLHDPRRGLRDRLPRRRVREGCGYRRGVLWPRVQDGPGRREDPRRDGHGRGGENGGGGWRGPQPLEDRSGCGESQGKPQPQQALMKSSCMPKSSNILRS